MRIFGFPICPDPKMPINEMKMVNPSGDAVTVKNIGIQPQKIGFECTAEITGLNSFRDHKNDDRFMLTFNGENELGSMSMQLPITKMLYSSLQLGDIFRIRIERECKPR